MKKHILITAVFSLCVLLTACSSTAESYDVSADLECIRGGVCVDRIVFEDLYSLEEAVDIVVTGKFIADAEQNITYEYDAGFGKNVVTMVESYNTIEVKKVLKGDVSAGDNLVIGQYYGIVDGDLITFSSLTPMQKGDEWLFFLKGSGDGNYWCWGDCAARYPVPNTENARIKFSDDPDLGVYNEEDFNRDIYNEILEKYDL